MKFMSAPELHDEVHRNQHYDRRFNVAVSQGQRRRFATTWPSARSLVCPRQSSNPLITLFAPAQRSFPNFTRAAEKFQDPNLEMGVAFQTIGMIGSFVIASSLVPQMHKVYLTKSAKDISLRFQLLYCFGIGLILIYGFGENLWPIYIPATVEEVAGLIMLAMKLYYDGNAAKLGSSGADDESHALELGASPLTRRSETKFTGVAHTP